MPISMGDQFKGLPMDELIGAPLKAACDAQVRLANATAGFIQQIGFEPKDPGKDIAGPADLKVRNVAFRFSRPRAPLPHELPAPGSPPADVGTVVGTPMEDVEISVPLLSIVRIPALAITTVDITFDMEVKNTERTSQVDDTSGKFSADASVGWGPFSLKVHVEGSVSSHKENTRETDQSAKYHVEVRAEDKGMPEGLARVLEMMNQAIAPKTVTATAPATTQDAAGTGTDAKKLVAPDMVAASPMEEGRTVSLMRMDTLAEHPDAISAFVIPAKSEHV